MRTIEQQLHTALDERATWRERAQQQQKLLHLAIDALTAAHEALYEERKDLAATIKKLRS